MGKGFRNYELLGFLRPTHSFVPFFLAPPTTTTTNPLLLPLSSCFVLLLFGLGCVGVRTHAHTHACASKHDNKNFLLTGRAGSLVSVARPWRTRTPGAMYHPGLKGLEVPSLGTASTVAGRPYGRPEVESRMHCFGL